MRARRMTIVLLATFAALAGLAAPAGAEGETVQGVLETIDGADRAPVEGVRITASLDGEAIGEAVSAGDGSWTIPVPGPGTYLVTLDVESLPDDVALTDPDRFELPNVSVRAGQEKTVRFQLGPGISGGTSTATRVAELGVVGLKLGAIIALSAIGLSLIFGVTGLVNFAHGELVTLGAIIAWWFNVSAGLHIAVAAIPAVAIVAGFGAVQETRIWRPLRNRKTGNIAMLVVTIGLSFLIRYGFILVPFGGQPQPYQQYAVQGRIGFLGIETVPKNLVIIAASLVILAAIGLMLQRTQIGTAMRAVADNPDLARSSGINVDRVVLVTWTLGAGLAALGGVFLGVSEIVDWQMGFRLLLLIFAAVVLGGLGTAYGAMVGGLIVGLAAEMSTLVIDVEFKTVIALGALIIMLLFRPQGLLGKAERIG